MAIAGVDHYFEILEDRVRWMLSVPDWLAVRARLV